MCDFNLGFKLCSCGDEKIRYREADRYHKVKGELVKIPNKKNDDIPIIYIWHLARYIGAQKNFMLGRYLFPVEDIGKGLNAEWILLNLNVDNCFDFDYIPNEGDNLTLTTNVVLSPYVSFIFKNGEWTAEHYDPNADEINFFAHGKIQAIE